MPGGRILGINEELKLPGVGFVITSGEPAPNLAAGVAAYIGRANKGPLGTATRVYSRAHLERVFGTLGESGNTMDGANEALLGGATAVEVMRLGAAGAPAVRATVTLPDGAATQVARVDAKDYGTAGNTITIGLRANASDATKQDLIVYAGGIQRELFTYTKGTDAAGAAAAAVAAQGSDYITLTKLATGDGTIANNASIALTGGANPTITNASYTDAMALLGARPWTVVSTDNETNTVHGLLKTAIDDLIMRGRRRMLVVAEPVTVTWTSRMANAKVLNDPAVVYVGTAFERSSTAGNVAVEGYRAAGREAGRHSVLPLGRQLTHSRLPDGVTTREAVGGVATSGAALTDQQLEEGVAAGMYLYYMSDDGYVRTVDGVTTYTTTTPPIWAVSADAGWGKSRLVLTRFKLFDGINDAWDPMIENTSNTATGRASVLRAAKDVIEQTFVPAGAVTTYALAVSASEPPEADMATFDLECTTPDGLTKLKLVAKFRR